MTCTSPALSTASKRGIKPLVLVWKIVRTPTARSCSRTAPAAVPSYISKVSPVGSGLEAAPCGAAAGLDPALSCANAGAADPAPRAIPDTAVAARKSLLDTGPEPGALGSAGVASPFTGGRFDAGFCVLSIVILDSRETYGRCMHVWSLWGRPPVSAVTAHRASPLAGQH